VTPGAVENKDLNLSISNTFLLKLDFDLVLTRNFSNFTTKGISSRLFTSDFGRENDLSKETVCISYDFF
jgi:hypothetical protein